ncbi:MAG TPA: hemerythrin domain-containing protein [Fimbriimonadaceae bacterium]|nr:hemerythrin domain-containing protein [Fimbriimonadaceae bacterium]
MKRHPSLQPLSRDHNVALLLARRLEREPNGDRLREFLEVWNGEMEDHFFDEERLLLNYASPAMTARMLEEHMRIRQYAIAAQRGMLCADDIVRLGGLLHSHVRWEERELFPIIESSATDDELAAIGVETKKLEYRRDRSQYSPRRGELMGC